MSEPICYLNGEFLPASAARVSVTDLGFIHGVTVAEQIRTFHRQPFLLAEHLTRFERGLDLLGIVRPDRDEFVQSIQTVVKHNRETLGPDQEMGICVFATPGESIRFQPSAEGSHQGATFCIHTYVLPHQEMNNRYRNRVSVGFATNQDVPSGCWPKKVKIRSRMHYYLADQAQRNRDGQEKDWIPLLTANDANSEKQWIREASTSTPIYVFKPNELTVSPCNEILSSISLDFVLAIAGELGITIVRREVCIDEILEMQSIFLVSTPFCIYDVQSIMDHQLHVNSRELNQIKQRWKAIVNCDFESQGFRDYSE